MAISRATGNIGLNAVTSGATTLAKAFTNNVGAGSLIVVGVAMSTLTTLSSVTDDQSNSYSQINTQTNEPLTQRNYLHYAQNATAGATTVTATASGTAVMHIVINEYPGADTTAALITQASAKNESGSATTPASGNMAMGGTAGLAVGWASLYPMSTNPPGAGSGFTRQFSTTAVNLYALAYEDYLVSDGTYDANWAETQSYWNALGAVFKEASGGGGGKPYYYYASS